MSSSRALNRAISRSFNINWSDVDQADLVNIIACLVDACRDVDGDWMTFESMQLARAMYEMCDQRDAQETCNDCEIQYAEVRDECPFCEMRENDG